MLNKMELIGYLGGDATIRRTGKGDAFLTLSIATSERFKRKDGEYETSTQWHDLVIFPRTEDAADKIANAMVKGRFIQVEGQHVTKTYEDKDGNKRKSSFCKVNRWLYLDKLETNQSTTGNGGYPGGMAAESIPNDDVPF
ncbi:MAG: Single-stranded DNA-binding protein [Syntrophus sp. SKADARSKE-3]|nr:Single-stranded DNA-binding protein [Syntrophus sp. SKADARSKE-3]